MDADAQTIVTTLNAIRLDENRSYAGLANEIGIDPGGLYKILNGRADPWDRTVHKLRRYLDQRAAAAKRRQTRRVG